MAVGETGSSLSSGSLVYRNYKEFRGVDFSNRKDEISIVRSPDALNMWQNYKNSTGNCVETRPDIEEVKELEDVIYGVYFFNGKMIVHSGKKLYENDKIIYENMAESKSKSFIYKNSLFIKDGTNYLVYDGTEVKEVVGYIPTTSISRKPEGRRRNIPGRQFTFRL